uniref:Uncharacterized protein n=1 Tax=Wuchereria bancrofti TaxID=6293 RepID=A0AAF5Q502_WUCBA
MFGHLHENDEMIEIAIETGKKKVLKKYLWMCKSNKSRRMSSSKHNSPENFKSNKEILSTVSVLGAGSKRVS